MVTSWLPCKIPWAVSPLPVCNSQGPVPDAGQPSWLPGTMVVVECFCAGEVCVALSSLPLRWRVRTVVRELTLH